MNNNFDLSQQPIPSMSGSNLWQKMMDLNQEKWSFELDPMDNQQSKSYKTNQNRISKWFNKVKEEKEMNQ